MGKKGKKLLRGGGGRGNETGSTSSVGLELGLIREGGSAVEETEVSKPAEPLAALISNKEAGSAGGLQPLNLDSAL